MSGQAANESEPPRHALDPVLLDRLVDGELAEAERRKLLLSLDRQPSGWRQCALAFLEAQSWRELFGASAEESAATPKPTATPASAEASAGAESEQSEERREVAPLAGAASSAVEAGPIRPAKIEPAGAAAVRPRRRLPKQWLWAAEMAASFLIAFSLGIWIRGGLLTTTGGRPSAPIAATVPGNTASRTLQVVAEGAGGKVEQMQVPLVDNSRLQWWQSQPAAVVPEDVRQAIERAGGQIRQERKYFPVELPDGRRALVPIDQIEVVPAGNRGMQ